MNLDSIEQLEAIDSNSCPEGIDESLWETWNSEEHLKKDKFLNSLKRGMEGKNVGLANGLVKINNAIYGTHKARYYLDAGESGAGKSTVSDYKYVFNAWTDARRQKRPIKIIYFSFELGREEKLYRWASYFIYLKYKVRLPSDYLHGKITGKLLSISHRNMVLDAYATIKEMLKDIVIVEESMAPERMFNSIVEGHFAKHGTIDRGKPIPTQQDPKGAGKGPIIGYTENNPELVTLIMTDHMGLIDGDNVKVAIDKWSKFCIALRNLFHATIVNIQQFSTDMMSAYRGNHGKKEEKHITPTRLDFGESKNPFKDADVVIGYVKPQNDFESFKGYSLLNPFEDGLGQYFVASYLMKNRYGPSNIMFPMFLDYISGIAYDLPLDPNPLAMEEWVLLAQELETVSKSFKPIN